MKMIAKRSLCVLLLLCMLMSLLVACKKNDEGEGEGEESTVSTTTAATTNKYEISDDLGDIDLGGREINIGNVNRSLYYDEVSVERYTGDIVNDSIYNRNKNLEARANIKINNVRVGDTGANQYAVINSIRDNVLTGDHEYDFVIAPIYCTISATGEGLLQDLNKAGNINLSKPYWSQYFNESMSIGDSQFMATGAISLSYYRFLYVTVVNDRVLTDDTSAPNLIDVVNSGQWTLEYQKTLTSKYYNNEGSSEKDEGDGFGLITTDYNGVDGYWSSCKISMLKKTSDNYYEYALDVDRLSSVVDQVISMFQAESTWCVPHDPSHETGVGEWDAINKLFVKGKSLMATVRLGAVESVEFRNMSDEYTILPMPKYDTNQDKYYSYVQDSFTGVAIPSTLPAYDLDDVSKVIEAMASESYRTVTPAYYETALKAKYAGSEESVEMIDMIADNVYVDGGEMYTKELLNISQLFRNIVRDAIRQGKGNTTSSTYSAEYATNVKAALKTLQDDIKKVQNGN